VFTTKDPASQSEREQIVARFEQAWQRGECPVLDDYLPPGDAERRAVLPELVHMDLERRLKTGEAARVEAYLQRYPELAERLDVVLDLARAEYSLRRRGELDLRLEEYCRRFPQCADQLRDWQAERPTVPPAAPPEEVETGPDPSSPSEAERPTRLGRYRVTKELGRGGFGVVYEGYDDELRRPVAIKVAHRHLVAEPEAAEAYLTEARVLAALDHAHIVPVYDVGRTDDGLCYVVSKFIAGSDLKAKLAAGRPSFPESAGLVATVAEALHHAHRMGLVHRDIKPANILIDAAGNPFVADFGLALHEEDLGRGSGFAGTPAYMSPEQASGEGHRVDGRSDIFSLGVVFYELLTGRRPFRAGRQSDVLNQIITLEARPLRQVDDAIPKELERICLKALAKRASERYTTAADLAEDLRHWLAGDASQAAAQVHVVVPPAITPPVAGATDSSQRPLKIVPKGLRSFDAGDADFFLELLPGPRDRDGLPDSIRFWKTRIEATDPDETFAVGLLYGPSGCGKSSLVKAGLLPRLAGHVVAVYVEATAAETETRLLHGLRKRCPNVPPSLGLKDALAALRRGQGLPPGQKVLLVLDQFEQWLHARKPDEPAELVQALRQCDGSRVQAVVMVRDDFWLAVSRFLKEVEIDILQGRNTALVDLFDSDHAHKVLTALGRAFGKLPEKSGEMSKEQREFLRQAVAGLSQDHKVICVRLALFAEMMKGRPWTPVALKRVGGTGGVGVTFLEDAFSSPAANPTHRLHQKAARAVLQALLPEAGTDIKGHMQSDAELLAASGYTSRRDFDELIRILDRDIRFLTPTDPEGAAEDEVSRGDKRPRLSAGEHPAIEAACGHEGKRYYQLTHDYLVPSLRDWLTRKQKETRRGRAELLLADRAAVWIGRPENRQLPSLLQCLQFRWLTRKKDWTPPQHKMMRKATRYHALRAGIVAVLLALAAWGAFEVHGRLRAAALVQTLATAETADVPRILADLAPYRRWAEPRLVQMAAQAEPDSKKRLHAALALAATGPGQEDYLVGRLLTARPGEVPVIRDALSPEREAVAARLWTILEDDRGEGGRRLRAAAALATYEPDSPRWAAVRGDVVRLLVSEPTLLLAPWAEILRPVRSQLVPLLVDRLQDADAARYPPLLLMLQAYPEEAVVVLDRHLEQKPAAAASPADKEALARRQANVATALLQLCRPERLWPSLAQAPDPTLRTFLIHRLGPLGADPQFLVQRLAEEPDVSLRRALLLALGEMSPESLGASRRQALVDHLLRAYRDDPDPGIHAAVDWLLRRWKLGQALPAINQEWAKDSRQREQRLERIRQEWAQDRRAAKPQWYVNGQGQTLALVPGPVEFLMGSSPGEGGQYEDETQHRRRIPRSFAVATRAVTVAEYKKFRPDFPYQEQVSSDPSAPINRVSWYDAAAYCNWLSQREGIPEEQWCYVANPTPCVGTLALLGAPLRQGPLLAASGLLPEGAWLVPEYLLAADHLHRTGYRLPTEAAWEYTCRAGTAAPWAHGLAEGLLDEYAWYDRNAGGRMHPVGLLKPNDLGLFDMHGNALQWCQNEYEDHHKGVR
jgi:serine/threonine protein kinase/formylglycine-generating enzyme required for sulfatase activity